jgi:hypothetical protein
MATSTLGNGTLVLAGTTSGTTTVTATAVAGTTTLTLPAATDTLVGKATTDTLTNKTLTGAVMNGTVGATTPSTGAFTTLSSSGLATLLSSQITGATFPSSGSGLELVFQSGTSKLQSFNRTGSAYLPLTIDGTTVGVLSSGATIGAFTSTGLAVTGLVDISAATSGQIKFPATQNASSNANTLDDYEEGTWVVTFTASSSGTITLSTATNEMSYIKVGSQVTIFGRVLISSVSSPSGSIQINLPFAPETGLADQSDFYGLPIMTHDVDLSAGALTVFGESSGSNYIVVYQVIDNAAWTPLPASNLKGNGNEYFYITGSYRAA